MKRFWRKALAGGLVVAAVGTGLAGSGAAGSRGEELWAGAEARIERHRKADAVVEVLDAAGKPVPEANVAAEQTRHAFLFGCNIFPWGTCPTPEVERAYRERFAALLNYATLPFYWGPYEAEQGRPDHARTEEVARWCRAHGIAVKGHPLAWNNADPAWLPDDPEEIRRLQMARIEDCVARFAGLVDRWDVVNEVVDYDRPHFVLERAPKMSAMWRKVGQMDFARECFVHARKAGPKATLVINDFQTSPKFERVVEQLVDDRGRRLYDVIGIQSHMHRDVWPTERIWEVCERFARFGVPIHFTEMTIQSGEIKTALDYQTRYEGWRSTPEGEARQAREVVRFYTMLFSHPAVEAITWWDLWDERAWLGAPAGLVRKDLSPKPAYEELLKRVKGAWWTRASLRSGADGTGRFRGFLGDYKVTVTAPGKAPLEASFTLRKGDPNRWVVKAE